MFDFVLLDFCCDEICIFSIRLTKETKTTAKTVNYAKKSKNYVSKLVVPKPRNRSFETIRHQMNQIILYSEKRNLTCFR